MRCFGAKVRAYGLSLAKCRRSTVNVWILPQIRHSEFISIHKAHMLAAQMRPNCVLCYRKTINLIRHVPMKANGRQTISFNKNDMLKTPSIWHFGISMCWLRLHTRTQRRCAYSILETAFGYNIQKWQMAHGTSISNRLTKAKASHKWNIDCVSDNNNPCCIFGFERKSLPFLKSFGAFVAYHSGGNDARSKTHTHSRTPHELSNISALCTHVRNTLHVS